jgi:hypothetical protein
MKTVHRSLDSKEKLSYFPNYFFKNTSLDYDKMVFFIGIYFINQHQRDSQQHH